MSEVEAIDRVESERLEWKRRVRQFEDVLVNEFIGADFEEILLHKNPTKHMSLYGMNITQNVLYKDCTKRARAFMREDIADAHLKEVLEQSPKDVLIGLANAKFIDEGPLVVNHIISMIEEAFGVIDSEYDKPFYKETLKQQLTTIICEGGEFTEVVLPRLKALADIYNFYGFPGMEVSPQLVAKNMRVYLTELGGLAIKENITGYEEGKEGVEQQDYIEQTLNIIVSYVAVLEADMPASPEDTYMNRLNAARTMLDALFKGGDFRNDVLPIIEKQANVIKQNKPGFKELGLLGWLQKLFDFFAGKPKASQDAELVVKTVTPTAEVDKRLDADAVGHALDGEQRKEDEPNKEPPPRFRGG